MKHLAITGNLGSGKSTACRLFGVLGIPTYYSDTKAKWLMQNDKVLVAKIIKVLGAPAYNKKGILDRKFIASRIFSDPKLLKKMNAIVHPAVREDYMKWRNKQKADFTLQESALTFEIKAQKIMDATILVYAPEELLIHRGMLRDKASEKQIRKRLSKQMSQEKKRKLADFTLNNGLGDSLLVQIINLYDKLSEK